jgi:NitT/TauT family transport system ATP-binding protein
VSQREAAVKGGPSVGSADLPAHRRQSTEVSDRFLRLYQRPVVLDVKAVERRFVGEDGPVLALDKVSFRAHRRELLCVVGPSGCGKSTLGRILAGLDEPTGGEVQLDGRPVHGPGCDRGMVFQGYTLFPWRTVLSNVMFGLEMTGRSRGDAEQEARPWVEMVGLGPFANAYPYQLSGGMKQRVAIARALANRPRILIMDEPFGALDAQTRAQMQSYLLQLWKQVDVTIVFVTHDLEEAVYLGDRVIVMGCNPGRILEVVEVPVPRPRHPDQMETPLFIATRRHISGLIHRDRAVTTDKLPVVRMTVVGDDVE